MNGPCIFFLIGSDLIRRSLVRFPNMPCLFSISFYISFFYTRKTVWSLWKKKRIHNQKLSKLCRIFDENYTCLFIDLQMFWSFLVFIRFWKGVFKRFLRVLRLLYLFKADFTTQKRLETLEPYGKIIYNFINLTYSSDIFFLFVEKKTSWNSLYIFYLFDLWIERSSVLQSLYISNSGDA